MKKFILHLCCFLVCCLIASSASVIITTNAATATDKPTSKPVLAGEFKFAKFDFNGDPKKGKDPFYPNSERSKEPVKVAVKTPGTETIVPPPAPKLASTSFTLKGILGTKARRMVMISTPTDSYEFVGNKAETVTTPEGRVKVHVTEFRRESVIIAVEGEEKPVELKLDAK